MILGTVCSQIWCPNFSNALANSSLKLSHDEDIHDCLFNSFYKLTSHKTSQLNITGPWRGESM